MGCAGSKADDSPGGRSREASAPASAPAVGGDAARAGRGALGARSPAGGVSKKVLEQLRSAFLVTATPGSVYDYYALSTTLGARVCHHARTAVHPRPPLGGVPSTT